MWNLCFCQQVRFPCKTYMFSVKKVLSHFLWTFTSTALIFHPRKLTFCILMHVTPCFLWNNTLLLLIYFHSHGLTKISHLDSHVRAGRAEEVVVCWVNADCPEVLVTHMVQLLCLLAVRGEEHKIVNSECRQLNNEQRKANKHQLTNHTSVLQTYISI